MDAYGFAVSPPLQPAFEAALRRPTGVDWSAVAGVRGRLAERLEHRCLRCHFARGGGGIRANARQRAGHHPSHP